MSSFNIIGEFFDKVASGSILLPLAAFIAALLVSLILIPFIIRLSIRFNLVDKPNERKVHKVPVSRLGGVGIIAGTLVTAPLWFLEGDVSLMTHLLAGLLILVALGIADDLKELSPKIKFAGQTIAALIIAHGGLLIDSLYGIFGIYEIPVVIQYILTVFIVVGIINAFNLIDGIDGLAGGLALIDMTGFFILFMVSGNAGASLVAAGCAGALLGFLKYNYHPARIFMGDTGSMSLGFLLSAAGIMALTGSRGDLPHFNYSETAIMVFSIFILPVYDTLRVFAGRILNRKSPFSPDKTHIHHLLMKTGFNHPRSAKVLYTANIVLIMTGFLLRSGTMSLVAPLLFLEVILFSEFLTLYKLIKAWFQGRKLKNKALKMQGDNRLIMDNLEDKDGKE